MAKIITHNLTYKTNPNNQRCSNIKFETILKLILLGVVIFYIVGVISTFSVCN